MWYCLQVHGKSNIDDIRPPFNNIFKIFLLILFLIQPRLAYADGMAGIVCAAIVLQLIIVLSVLLAIFGKVMFCRFLFTGIKKPLLRPFLLSMFFELAIMTAFVYSFLTLTGKNYDMRITNYLSYISADAAIFYFQKIITEHKLIWSIITKLLVAVFVLPLLNFLPNYKLLVEEYFKRGKQWLYTYLLSLISPTIFCFLSLLVVVAQKHETNDFMVKHQEPTDIENDLLRQAAATGFSQLAKVAITEGADVNAKSKYDRRTALHEAVGIPHNIRTVRLLLQKGADVNSKSSYDLTPLMIACSYTWAEDEIVQLLIDNRADINAKAFPGDTALTIASRRNQGKYGVRGTRIEKMLIDHGADVNFRDAKGRTALMGASIARNFDLVKLLLEHGADVNIKDKDGKTAYTLSYDPNIKQILADHGAIF